MLRINLILLAVVLAWRVVEALRNAPEGFEDETGFHIREPARMGPQGELRQPRSVRATRSAFP